MDVYCIFPIKVDSLEGTKAKSSNTIIRWSATVKHFYRSSNDFALYLNHSEVMKFLKNEKVQILQKSNHKIMFLKLITFIIDEDTSVNEVYPV
jgi:hypothetical protein